MKDTSGGDIGISKLTAIASPKAGVWYEGWKCSECGKNNLAIEVPPQVAHVPLSVGHVRIECLHCHADRIYPANERVRVLA